ncbi:MAG: tRNA (5-methylaminomethyl-2-thiouridine)(34)-methyltransferase MnmD [Tannerellaceae bacterium]|jgi:tRNA U34 5-methylaminomethyl-2-thiouridine-forming methyltransferase MnmC|nr:tRNA (5-methylaminomethyl-2-thiouridine)(34)-methyltransferase MnmD [Tannerellaceae bacterium]
MNCEPDSLIVSYLCRVKKLSIQLTADGSHTLFVPEIDEHYHSVNGAIQESYHVFIKAGWQQAPKGNVRIVEIGFGTGLNALLTLLCADVPVEYYTVEPEPLPLDTIRLLNYAEILCPGKEELFLALHTAAWDTPVKISSLFTLYKIRGDGNTCTLPGNAGLVYFDAFAPDKQPGMWNPAIFRRLYEAMAEGGILTTYCAKGSVRRMMQEAGYSVERIAGPPGKREMLRATKQ